MDKIILGLLMLQSRSIYQLRDRVNKGLHMMYSSSMGSIQAAVKKLLGSGLISFDEVFEDGKRKKIYSITDAGREHFLRWVNTPMDFSCGRNPELAKLYFMGFSDKAVRAEAIRELIAGMRENHRALGEICRQGEDLKPEDEARDIINYQLMSAKYGMDLVQFNIEWYTRLLSDMENGRV